MYKKINRNSDSMYSHTNRVRSNESSPDLYVEPVWLTDKTTTGVQIVELKSSGSEKSPHNGKDSADERRNTWIYMKQKQQQEEFLANNSARRRLEEKQFELERADFSNNACIYDDGNAYGDVYVSKSNEGQNERVIYNQHVNCFTILDKHLNASDSSEEDIGNLGVDMETETDWNCDARTYAEVLQYDPNVPNESRTVWIYSFKNKHLLTENAFELVNIPSNDTSNNSSIENFQEIRQELPSTERLPSPNVPVHVPRLHIPQTPPLPTLTEIEESSGPRKQSSCNQTESSGHLLKEEITFKENSWCKSDVISPIEEHKSQGTNVVQWMALSPRQKRQRFRKVTPISVSNELINKLESLKEKPKTDLMYELNKPQINEDIDRWKPCKSTNPFIDEMEELKENKDDIVNLSKTCVSKETSTDHMKSFVFEETQTDIQPSTSKSPRRSILGHISDVLVDTAKRSVRSIMNSSSVSKATSMIIGDNSSAPDSNNVTIDENKSKYSFYTPKPAAKDVYVKVGEDIIVHSVPIPKPIGISVNEDRRDNSSVGERGDYNRRIQRPRILISPKTPISRSITGPLEKLDSDSWIQEEGLVDAKVDVPGDARGDIARNNIWIRNMSLLKPAQWTEYLPITESVPSLHLSLNTDSDIEEITWTRRVANFFKCCKK